MNRKHIALLTAVLALILISTGLGSTVVFAHHNVAALYDRTKVITVTGTITEFLLINPHTRIDFEVKDENGNVEKWTAWSGPPAGMFRRGWRKDSLKPGDKIVITGAIARDGSKQMTVQRLEPPDRSVPVLTLGAE
jgi:hydrogenase maturation factor